MGQPGHPDIGVLQQIGDVVRRGLPIHGCIERENDLGYLGFMGTLDQRIEGEVLRAALDWCSSGTSPGGGPILGCEPNDRALRFGLERSYRALARLTPDQARRIELVDLANAVRPRTLT